MGGDDDDGKDVVEEDEEMSDDDGSFASVDDLDGECSLLCEITKTHVFIQILMVPNI